MSGKKWSQEEKHWYALQIENHYEADEISLLEIYIFSTNITYRNAQIFIKLQNKNSESNSLFRMAEDDKNRWSLK